MPQAIAGPVIATVAGGLANKLFGGHGQTTTQLPADMQGMRSNQIQLLNYLTGFGGMPAAMGGAIPPMPHNPAEQIRWIQQYGSAAKQRQAGGMPGTPQAGWGAQPQQGQPLGQYNYASGGYVSGPGGPKSDAIDAKLSNGEGVLTAEAVNALGGPSIVQVLNLLGAMHQHSSAGAPQHFANGGIAGDNWLTQNFPQLRAPPAPAQAPSLSMDPRGMGGMPQLPTGSMGGGPGAPPTPDAQLKSPNQQRFEGIYGQLGIPTTALQRQSVGGMQQFLASDPYGQARSALNQILGDPGGAFRPDFSRALAQANQTGGRFGSQNAMLNAQALNDYNSAALKQQLGAAQGIQGLGAQQANDLTGGYNMGQQYANQLASGQQQAIQMLNQALGTAQQATFGAPTQQQPSDFGQFMQGAGSVAQLLPFLNSGANQQSSAPGYQNTNWIYRK
jgi:hypothetical protein